MTSEASIRIKLGQLEIDYQGDSSFLKDHLVATTEQLLKLQSQYPTLSARGQKHEGDGKANSGGGGSAVSGGKYELSTDTIATLFSAKTGPDLLFAAAVHLTLVKRKEKFTRQEVLSEMQSAPGHYKDSYSGNLTSYLTGLTGKDRLRLVAENTYALSARERQAVEAKLAEG